MTTFKLTIKKGDNQKTLSCKSYDITLGTFEDLLQLAEITKSESDVAKSMSFIKPLLLDMFPEATEEDLRHAKVKDIFNLLHDAIIYAVSEIGSKKNG